MGVARIQHSRKLPTTRQNGIFHDLPAIVVDPVRTATSDPCAHRVYVGWATFTGADGAGKLSFARTTAGDGPNWNPTWQKQVIKTGPTLTNQGVMLAVDPRPGTYTEHEHRRWHAVLRMAGVRDLAEPRGYLADVVEGFRCKLWKEPGPGQQDAAAVL